MGFRRIGPEVTTSTDMAPGRQRDMLFGVVDIDHGGVAYAQTFALLPTTDAELIERAYQAATDTLKHRLADLPKPYEGADQCRSCGGYGLCGTCAEGICPDCDGIGRRITTEEPKGN